MDNLLVCTYRPIRARPSVRFFAPATGAPSYSVLLKLSYRDRGDGGEREGRTFLAGVRVGLGEVAGGTFPRHGRNEIAKRDGYGVRSGRTDGERRGGRRRGREVVITTCRYGRNEIPHPQTKRLRGVMSPSSLTYTPPPPFSPLRAERTRSRRIKEVPRTSARRRTVSIGCNGISGDREGSRRRALGVYTFLKRGWG